MKLAKRGKHQERVGLDATSKAEKRRTYKEGPGTSVLACLLACLQLVVVIVLVGTNTHVACPPPWP